MQYGLVCDPPMVGLSQKNNGLYARYMDDIIVLAPTHHKLRGMIKAVCKHLEKARLWVRPEKTYVGKKEKGFTFLGYAFDLRQACLR